MSAQKINIVLSMVKHILMEPYLLLLMDAIFGNICNKLTLRLCITYTVNVLMETLPVH